MPGIEDAVALAFDGPGHLLVRPRGSGFPTAVERLDLATGARTPWRTLAPPERVGVGPLSRLVVAPGGSVAFGYRRVLSDLLAADVPGTR